MAFFTAIADLLRAARQALSRTGVHIGGTAQYPRVEIHSLVEGSPETKDNSVRQITCTIESISDEKIADVIQLTTDNIALLFDAAKWSLEDFDVIGIVPGQIRLLEEEEAPEQNKVIYRLLQDITVWVERKNNQ